MKSELIFEIGSPLRHMSSQELGGKGFQLAELSALGYNVPPGFIITSSALVKVLDNNPDQNKEINSLALQIESSNASDIETLATKLRKIITTLKVPSFLSTLIEDNFNKLSSSSVAVRSSAVCEDGHKQSYAGMFDTYLNTSLDTIFEAIKNCWASQFTARAIAYTKNSHTKYSGCGNFAIVIQRMISAEISGVCFTQEIDETDSGNMLIEAVWGLGESLVAGEVTPDSYILRKNDLSIVKSKTAPQLKMRTGNSGHGTTWSSVAIHRSQQSKLTGNLLRELATTFLDLERTFEYPCDIEWTVADNTIYLLQCRPITTVNAVIS